MQHVVARHRAQLGTVSLAHVSQFFACDKAAQQTNMLHGIVDSQKKMSFDSVKIRHLYYDVSSECERFDELSAFDNTEIGALNLITIVAYNVQDCLAVYLMRNVDYLATIIAYAQHFFVPVIHAGNTGNSKLLAQSIVVRALNDSRLVIPFREHPMLRLHPNIWSRMLNWSTQSSQKYDEFRSIDDLSTMRIDEHKLYIGGLNTASSGHFPRTLSVDFASFYPSIGCSYGLSMENVHIVTIQQLRELIPSTDTLNTGLTIGAIRLFDYEPPDASAVNRRCPFDFEASPPPRMSECVRTLRKHIAENNGDNNTFGWYEGVELFTNDEIQQSTNDSARRRLLMIWYNDIRTEPVVCSLWRDYLSKRAAFKRELAELCNNTDDLSKRQRLQCMEKMMKVVANSLYGYLNYKQSIIYAPAVAAAITLLSRKTFNEMTWTGRTTIPFYLIAENDDKDDEINNDDNNTIHGTNERTSVGVIYRDTDGAIFTLPINMRIKNEKILVRRINGILQEAHNVADTRTQLFPSLKCDEIGTIRIEIEYANCSWLSIMGKKKYWRFHDNRSISRGFERNARPYIKSLVRTIQKNTTRMLQEFTRKLTVTNTEHGIKVRINDVIAYYVCVFDWLHEYFEQNSVEAFAFGIPLNPRLFSQGAENTFINRILSTYNYEIGDRATCLSVNEHNVHVNMADNVNDDIARSSAARLILLGEYMGELKETRGLNYYKFIRRIAIYLLQIVEGGKRTDMSSGQFDTLLQHAYVRWRLHCFDNAAKNMYGPFFTNDPMKTIDVIHTMVRKGNIDISAIKCTTD